MKLIIDVADYRYDQMQEMDWENTIWADEDLKAIYNGTPLNRLRAEIEQLPTEKCTETHRLYINAVDFKESVLAILDKYKAEGEQV